MRRSPKILLSLGFYLHAVIYSEVLLRACGKPEPLLDRNMIRVIERVFGIRAK
jgi:hypothetical protein